MNKDLYYQKLKPLSLSRYFAVSNLIQYLNEFLTIIEENGSFDERDFLDDINHLMHMVNNYHAQIGALNDAISLVKYLEERKESINKVN